MANQNGQNHASKPNDLDDLGARLNAARAKYEVTPDVKDDGSLLGQAWRMSTELVVSVIVGLGLGYGVDTIFGSKPWGILIGLCFGFAAGIMAVLRTSAKMDEQNAGVPLGDDMPDDENE
ncbi:MAG: AtpZ/AtpI family protein [Litorimonas sp.]